MPERAEGGRGYLGDGWILLSYLALSILFFLPALVPGQQVFGTDYLAGSYFLEDFATERFYAGELPKWMPYLYGGVPFFANPMDIFYPLSVLLRLLRVPTHEHLGIIFTLQFFLAGTGTYLLLRELDVRRMPAHVVGLLYMFSGYLISYVYAGHDGRAIVATLSPLFLFALHRGIRRGAWRDFVLGGVVLGAALLSFQIQTAYYLLLAAALWSLFLLWHFEAWRPVPVLLRRIAGGGVTLFLGFAVASVNFLPFLGYVGASPRGGEGRGYEYATSWSMPPEEVVGLAVPERIGLLDAYWGLNPFKLHTEYLGALAILLLLLGVYLLRRNRYGWFFLGLAAFTLTIAFGGHTPLYRLYYELLPGTARFRAPSTSFFLVVLSLSVFAGLAMDRLADVRARSSGSAGGKAAEEAGRSLRTMTYITAGALGLVLVWAMLVAATPPTAPSAGLPGAEAARAARRALNHEAYLLGIGRFGLFLLGSAAVLWLWVRDRLPVYGVASLLVGLVVTDLWIIDKKFFETAPGPSVYFAPDEIVSFLERQPKPFRTFVLFDLPQDNYMTLFGIELLGGEHGNQLQSYNEFLGAGERTYTDFHNMGRPAFLGLANVRYLVSGRDVSAPFLEPVFRGRTRNGQDAVVYENRTVLPRAFLVGQARRVTEPDGAIQAMQQPGFDPRAEVLLYEDPPLSPSTGEGSPGTATIRQYEPDEVVVDVSASRDAYLLLTDNFYPGWTAEIDGDPVPLLRADHTFRAVPVSAGEHRVTFRFEPRSLAIGFRVYLIIWTLLAAYGAVLLVQARRAGSRS